MAKQPKRPEDHKKKKQKDLGDVTSAAAWKSKSTSSEPIPLEVPSGNTALVRPVGMQAFLSEGLIPNSLLGIVTSNLEKGEKGEAVDEEKVVEELIDDIRDNPERLVDVIKMADACTVYCVVQPVVLPAPQPGETRFADKLYVDEVDIDDKMFIMNFAVGGSRQLEPFRAATASGVERLAAVEDVEPPA